MRKTQKKQKMIDDYFDKDIKELYYSYKLWFALMLKLQGWIVVETILNKEFRMKYTKIYNSRFFKRWHKNKTQNMKESVEAFENYCIAGPGGDGSNAQDRVTANLANDTNRSNGQF
jgi:hypothetical protein